MGSARPPSWFASKQDPIGLDEYGLMFNLYVRTLGSVDSAKLAFETDVPFLVRSGELRPYGEEMKQLFPDFDHLTQAIPPILSSGSAKVVVPSERAKERLKTVAQAQTASAVAPDIPKAAAIQPALSTTESRRQQPRGTALSLRPSSSLGSLIVSTSTDPPRKVHHTIPVVRAVMEVYLFLRAGGMMRDSTDKDGVARFVQGQWRPTVARLVGSRFDVSLTERQVTNIVQHRNKLLRSRLQNTTDGAVEASGSSASGNKNADAGSSGDAGSRNSSSPQKIGDAGSRNSSSPQKKGPTGFEWLTESIEHNFLLCNSRGRVMRPRQKHVGQSGPRFPSDPAWASSRVPPEEQARLRAGPLRQTNGSASASSHTAHTHGNSGAASGTVASRASAWQSAPLAAVEAAAAAAAATMQMSWMGPSVAALSRGMEGAGGLGGRHSGAWEGTMQQHQHQHQHQHQQPANSDEMEAAEAAAAAAAAAAAHSIQQGISGDRSMDADDQPLGVKRPRENETVLAATARAEAVSYSAKEEDKRWSSLLQGLGKANGAPTGEEGSPWSAGAEVQAMRAAEWLAGLDQQPNSKGGDEGGQDTSAPSFAPETESQGAKKRKLESGSGAWRGIASKVDGDGNVNTGQPAASRSGVRDVMQRARQHAGLAEALVGLRAAALDALGRAQGPALAAAAKSIAPRRVQLLALFPVAEAVSAAVRDLSAQGAAQFIEHSAWPKVRALSGVAHAIAAGQSAQGGAIAGSHRDSRLGSMDGKAPSNSGNASSRASRCQHKSLDLQVGSPVAGPSADSPLVSPSRWDGLSPARASAGTGEGEEEQPEAVGKGPSLPAVKWVRREGEGESSRASGQAAGGIAAGAAPRVRVGEPGTAQSEGGAGAGRAGSHRKLESSVGGQGTPRGVVTEPHSGRMARDETGGSSSIASADRLRVIGYSAGSRLGSRDGIGQGSPHFFRMDRLDGTGSDVGSGIHDSDDEGLGGHGGSPSAGLQVDGEAEGEGGVHVGVPVSARRYSEEGGLGWNGPGTTT